MAVSCPQRRWFAIGEDLNAQVAVVVLRVVDGQRRWFAIGEDLNCVACSPSGSSTSSADGSPSARISTGGNDGTVGVKARAAPMVRHRRGSQQQRYAVFVFTSRESSADGSPSARISTGGSWTPLTPAGGSADGSPSARISTRRRAGSHSRAPTAAAPMVRHRRGSQRLEGSGDTEAEREQRRWFAIGEDLNLGA